MRKARQRKVAWIVSSWGIYRALVMLFGWRADSRVREAEGGAGYLEHEGWWSEI
jgi:hypothetical protein